MIEKDTIDQAPELFDQAGPAAPEAREIHPALAPAIQQLQQVPMEQRQAPDVSTAQGMLAVIIQDQTMTPGDRLAMAKELIALKNAEEDRAAEKEFNVHFAAMQGDFKPVGRTGEAKDNSGKKLYDFAPIEAIIKTNGGAISKHGFSHSFREEEIKDRGITRFFITINGWGHSRETFVDLPTGGAKAPLMNGAQASRGLQSYGQRYALIAGYGFVMADDDDDGAGFEDGIKLGQTLQLIREAKTQGERKALYIAAISRTDLDEREKGIVAAESKKRNKELVDAGVRE
jgi:hypothetical protein